MPEARYPILTLWCQPRSMSTAIERVMRERGDLTCFHEPFLAYLYGKPGIRRLPHAEPSAEPAPSFADVCDRLEEAARAGSVFLKDMAYYVVQDILEQPDIARRLRHAILIRDPRRSILSYHRLDSEVTVEGIGVAAAWELAQGIERITAQRPFVIEAEVVRRDPEGEIGRLWAAWDLPDRPAAFDWRPDAPPDDWRHVAGWHQSVINSAGIRPPEETTDPDADFAKAAAAEPRLAVLLAAHESAYRCLRDWAMRKETAR